MPGDNFSSRLEASLIHWGRRGDQGGSWPRRTHRARELGRDVAMFTFIMLKRLGRDAARSPQALEQCDSEFCEFPRDLRSRNRVRRLLTDCRGVRPVSSSRLAELAGVESRTGTLMAVPAVPGLSGAVRKQLY